jgi:hypothetical protein
MRTARAARTKRVLAATLGSLVVATGAGAITASAGTASATPGACTKQIRIGHQHGHGRHLPAG